MIAGFSETTTLTAANTRLGAAATTIPTQRFGSLQVCLIAVQPDA